MNIYKAVSNNYFTIINAASIALIMHPLGAGYCVYHDDEIVQNTDHEINRQWATFALSTITAIGSLLAAVPQQSKTKVAIYSSAIFLSPLAVRVRKISCNSLSVKAFGFIKVDNDTLEKNLNILNLSILVGVIGLLLNNIPCRSLMKRYL
ncbi:MAG: hypothetical protein ChlgKO_01070 [Chlamydiales bacterium]